MLLVVQEKIDVEGMKQDVAYHKRQRFDRSTPYRFLIHDGPRQTAHKRKNRLLKWLERNFGKYGAHRRTRF